MRTILLLAAALALAGCTGGSDEAGDDADAPGGGDAAIVRNETTSIPVSAQITGAPGPLEQPGAAGDVDVGANATMLYVEERIECPASCGHEIVVLGPDGAELARGAAPLHVEAPPAGACAIQVLFDGPTVQATGELRATVFYGGDMPEGFTAFADEESA